MDPLDVVLAMAKDWTDPVVVRDAPSRVPHVIEQLIEHCEALRDALVKVRAHTSYTRPDPDVLAGLLASIERITAAALNSQKVTDD